MRYAAFGVIALAAVCPCSAIGQEPPGVEPGDRIRITSPACGLERQEATLRSLERDVLLATAPGGTEIRCPVQSVTSLEASAGTRRRGWKPVGIGVGIGAGVGVLTALAIGAEGGCAIGECSDDPVFWIVATGAIIGGAGIGLIAGGVVGLTHTEDWREVEMPLPLFVFRSRDGRTGFGFSVPLRR